MNRDRTVRDLSKSASDATIPDFTGLQKKSFESFAQLSCEVDARNQQGLEGMLRALFPVTLQDGSQLDYDGYVVTPPALPAWECEKLARTFSSELRVRLRTNDENPVDAKAVDLPLMTERGTFIIGGTEKVIIGQLQAEEDTRVNDLAPGNGYAKRYNGGVLTRTAGDIFRADPSDVEYEPVHPSQALGVSASLIPFVANDDANRALMGVNMQKQAVPLMTPEAPIVQTGMERQVAADAHVTLMADASGEVTEITDDTIVIGTEDGDTHRYPYRQVKHPELGICLGHRPLVTQGDQVGAGQVIADGPATDGGVLALGQNVLVGYMPWKGYNFEDGIVVSDRLVRDDVFTSIRAREFTATLTPSRNEAIGTDHLETSLCRNLSQVGLVREGTGVKGNDILIGRGRNGKEDTSVRMPYGQSGTVVKVEHYCSGNGYMLDDGVAELARVTVATRRDLKVGDKLCNRHGAAPTLSTSTGPSSITGRAQRTRWANRRSSNWQKTRGA